MWSTTCFRWCPTTRSRHCTRRSRAIAPLPIQAAGPPIGRSSRRSSGSSGSRPTTWSAPCRRVPRPSPTITARASSLPNESRQAQEGATMPEWVDACAADDIDEEDVIRFDHGGRTFAIYRTDDDRYFATDGLCTHEQVHLADGLLMGTIIECPKHNG